MTIQELKSLIKNPTSKKEPYTINEKGEVDVHGNLEWLGTSKVTAKSFLPLQIGTVDGYFSCANSHIESLEGGPRIICGTLLLLNCDELKTLKGAPERIDLSFYCRHCTKLETIEYAPKNVKERYVFEDTPSISAEECTIIYDKDLLDAWLNSDLSLKDFMTNKRGLIMSTKFGF